MRSRRVTGLVMGVALGGAALLTAFASPLEGFCVDEYYGCLNEAYAESGDLTRQLKYVECGASYVGCLKGLLR